MLGSINLEASIQDNELQVLEKNKPNTNETVILSVDTGLLGSPEPLSNGVIQVRALLQSGLTPGSQVNVVSKSTNIGVGILYKVQKANYTGSTFEEDWFVEFEGVQLDA